MAKGNDINEFLEPVYLNEKMVLNCAAYLFQGVPLQSEHSEKSERSGGVSASAGIPFLSRLLNPLNFEGDFKAGSVRESRSARQYTVGGLHMVVLNELRAKSAIQSLDLSMSGGDSARTGKVSYIDVEAVLTPTDYYATLATLKILGPLVARILVDFGDKLLKPGVTRQNIASQKKRIEGYEQFLVNILDQLESDYLTSKQVEMVMWSDHIQGVPLGVVDLDLSDYEPAELRAKLSGGRYRVIGKVTKAITKGGSLDLLQKTVLSNSIDLFLKLAAAQKDQLALEKAKSAISQFRDSVRGSLMLDMPGPAVRVAAMSVCI